MTASEHWFEKFARVRSIWDQYQAGDRHKLDHFIESLRELVDQTSSPELHAIVRTNLGAAHLERWVRDEQAEDIKEAVENLKFAVPTIPDQEYRATGYVNLTLALLHRYLHSGDSSDLEDALDASRETRLLESRRADNEDPDIQSHLRMTLERWVEFGLAKALSHTITAERMTQSDWYILLRKLVVARRFLGNEHQISIELMSQLASILHERGRLGEARELYEQAYASYRISEGRDHPGTLISASNLAILREQQGDLEGAKDIYGSVLDTWRRIGEPKMEAASLASIGLARCIGELGKPEQAAEMLIEAIQSTKHLHGEFHPITITAKRELASWTGEAGNAAAASEMLGLILRDCESVLGSNHPTMLTVRGFQASWNARSGRIEEALHQFETLLGDQERQLGSDHPASLVTRANIAAFMVERNDLATALRELSRLLVDQHRILGPDHPDVLSTRMKLAKCQADLGYLGASLSRFDQLSFDAVRVLGEIHPLTAMIFNYRRDVLHRSGSLPSSSNSNQAASPSGPIAVIIGINVADNMLFPDSNEIRGNDELEQIANRALKRAGLGSRRISIERAGSDFYMSIPVVSDSRTLFGSMIIQFVRELQSINQNRQPMKLRIAGSIGPTSRSTAGMSRAFIECARLLDSSPLRSLEIEQPGRYMRLIISDELRSLSKEIPELDFAFSEFRQVSVGIKGSHLNAWIASQSASHATLERRTVSLQEACDLLRLRFETFSDFLMNSDSALANDMNLGGPEDVTPQDRISLADLVSVLGELTKDHFTLRSKLRTEEVNEITRLARNLDFMLPSFNQD
ncbi:tetratricopeptide repeat protein [Glycomyces mayteni]|uniref:Tetratricopeptide repeat protein n=1 Tax=Glycomyces mayteni TaxID=543887 RepID=A0ABW2D8G9_9ACTN|nr:hypothetical protein GCM10025732_33170 [Glycomyces mayteni]